MELFVCETQHKAGLANTKLAHQQQLVQPPAATTATRANHGRHPTTSLHFKVIQTQSTTRNELSGGHGVESGALWSEFAAAPCELQKVLEFGTCCVGATGRNGGVASPAQAPPESAAREWRHRPAWKVVDSLFQKGGVAVPSSQLLTPLYMPSRR